MLFCAALYWSAVHADRFGAYTRDLVYIYLCPPVQSNDSTVHQAGLHSVPPGSHITTRTQPTVAQGYGLDQLTLHSLPSTLQRPRHRLRLDQICSEGYRLGMREEHIHTWSTLHVNPTPQHQSTPIHTPRVPVKETRTGPTGALYSTCTVSGRHHLPRHPTTKP